MSSISHLPSLSVLQASLSRSLAGLPSEAVQSSLEAVRQIPGLTGVSGLNALLTQGLVSRAVVRPALLGDLSQALGASADLAALRDALAPATLEERLEACAAVLDLRHGVQVFCARPTRTSEKSADLLLTGAIQLVGKSISRALKDELHWSTRLASDNVGAFAVSLRKAFDIHGEDLDARKRYDLMRLSAYLNEASPDLARYEESKRRQPEQGPAISTLIEVLYGCGFGDETSLSAADRLYRLPRLWSKLEPSERAVVFDTGAKAVRELLSDADAAEASLKPDVPSFYGAAETLRAHLRALES